MVVEAAVSGPVRFPNENKNGGRRCTCEKKHRDRVAERVCKSYLMNQHKVQVASKVN